MSQLTIKHGDAEWTILQHHSIASLRIKGDTMTIRMVDGICITTQVTDEMRAGLEKIGWLLPEEFEKDEL